MTIGHVKSSAKSVLIRANRRCEEIEIDTAAEDNKKIRDEIERQRTRWFFKKNINRDQAIKLLDKRSNGGFLHWRTFHGLSYYTLRKIIAMCNESIRHGDGEILLSSEEVAVLPLGDMQ